MLDTAGKLQSIEGTLKDLCLKLGVVEAQHIDGSPDERRRKLLKLAIGALRQLDGGSDTAAMSLAGDNLAPSGADLTEYLNRFGPPR
jgi:hypothetical protein